MKSIILSTEEVRAVLEGRKTQFRVPVDGLLKRSEMGAEFDELAKCCVTEESRLELRDGVLGIVMTAEEIDRCDWMPDGKPSPGWMPMVHGKGPGGRGIPTRCPFGAPGATLWVKETFAHFEQAPKDTAYFEDVESCSDPETKRALLEVLQSKWRSPIQMKQERSRITLRLESVRVERLWEITEEDAQSEGVQIGDCSTVNLMGVHRAVFADQLWDSRYEAKGFAWDTNPWVWVPTLRRVEA